MADKKKRFHEFALKSNLFKGRSDWYYCFLKAERISHVLFVLAQRSPSQHAQSLTELAEDSASIPKNIVGVAGGEEEVRYVLGDIFSMLFSIRLLHTQNVIAEETAKVLIEEYEALAEKLDAGERVSPFVSAEDFMIQPFELEEPERPLAKLPELAKETSPIKDSSYKGHQLFHKSQQGRSQQILDIVLQSNGVSIKDIAVKVRGCSEKTIQRELAELIRQGRIEKVGERRWSVYRPTGQHEGPSAGSL